MKIYVDEDTNPRIARFLPGHAFATPNSMQWAGLKNGRLLERLDGEFEVLLTHDQNLRHQQNLAKHAVRVLLLEMEGRLLSDYEAIAPEVQRALEYARPGECTVVRPPRPAS